MNLAIRGLGVATPRFGIDQSDAAELASGFCCQTDEQKRLLKALYRRSGVRRRYSVILQSENAVRRNPLSQSDTDSASVRNAHGSYQCELDPATATRAPALSVNNGSENAVQSFYWPANDEQDRGPTTADRMRVFEEQVTPLATLAIERAFEASGWTAKDVTHLVTVCCTGFFAPGQDLRLIRSLGMDPATQRTHIGFMGCHAALNGLRTALSIVRGDSSARVLLCAAELCSLHQQYGWNPQQVVSNAIFADGAAAVALAAPDGDGPSRHWEIADTQSALLPNSMDQMGWNIRDNGFVMHLAADVPETIQRELHDWLTRWLSTHNLRLEQIQSWAIHPGGPRILQSAADAIGIQRVQLQASYDVLAEFGNMSSPTILFVLQRLQHRSHSRPCVMLAFGPGLSIEAALLK